MNRKTYDSINRFFERRQDAKDYLETLHKAGKDARIIQTRNTMGNIVYKVVE